VIDCASKKDYNTRRKQDATLKIKIVNFLVRETVFIISASTKESEIIQFLVVLIKVFHVLLIAA
jgi:predicted ferric reductase